MRIRRRLPGALGLAALFAMVGIPLMAWAEPRPTGVAQRAPARAKASGAKPTESGKSGAGAKASAQKEHGAHRRGKAPSDPSPRMPAGAPRAEPDAVARNGVAGGDVGTREPGALDNRELQLLREAERVLFPEPTFGLVPGWSWDVSRPISDDRPRGDASGLPLAGAEALTRRDSEPVESWIKSLVLPSFDVRFHARVVTYLRFYRDNPRGRSIAKAWAKKSGRYSPSIRAMLEASGLPADLVWMSLVESGHDPTIKSPAGAAGLWQFIPTTARMYGLTVDRWVDERLDPRRATEAAILMLGDLNQRFGSWTLVMGAYNMGFSGLARAIRKYNTNDFFELSRFEAGLPWETSLYVPKIMATALMMNNKSAFGLDGVAPDEAERFDTVRVESGTPLADIAAAAAVTVEELRATNPQFLEDRLPPRADAAAAKSWAVRLPTGSGARAAGVLAKRGKGGSALVPHVVRFGDTVQSISGDLGFDVDKLRELNGIGLREELRPGAVILMPKSVATRSPEKQLIIVPPRAVGYPDRRRVFYEVSASETLGEIAQALTVDVDELVQHNALDASARLQPGMVVQAFVPKDADLRGVRYFTDQTARVLIAGTESYYDYFEGLNGQRRFTVKAQKGDTLASLAKRYGMTPGSIERVNRRSRADELTPGERVVVYSSVVPRSRDLATELAAAPLGAVTEPVPVQLPLNGPGVAAD